jgi:hypothetical protein
LHAEIARSHLLKKVDDMNRRRRRCAAGTFPLERLEDRAVPSGAGTLSGFTPAAPIHGATTTAPTVKPFTPVITQQPTNTTVPSNSIAKFTVGVLSDSRISVQWYYSTPGTSKFTYVKGARSTTLSLFVTTALSGDRYRARIMSPSGTVTSGVAYLTVV